MRLIDADTLKEWIDEYVSVFKKSDNKDIKGYIEHQPTIEPKRGEWRTTDTLAVCSECGTVFEKSQLFGITFANYCPYCGADMRGKDDE